MQTGILKNKEAANTKITGNTANSTTNPLQLKLPANNPLQLQAEETTNSKPQQNNNGLPENLKAGVEALSGYSMDDVKVHYNSDKPHQLQALAYAQGTDIHVGPGQEKHLPHEAWHVVQQKQGRVQPTMQMKQGIAVNDDKGLEYESDVMGEKALTAVKNNTLQFKSENLSPQAVPVIQRKLAVGTKYKAKQHVPAFTTKTGKTPQGSETNVGDVYVVQEHYEAYRGRTKLTNYGSGLTDVWIPTETDEADNQNFSTVGTAGSIWEGAKMYGTSLAQYGLTAGTSLVKYGLSAGASLGNAALTVGPPLAKSAMLLSSLYYYPEYAIPGLITAAGADLLYNKAPGQKASDYEIAAVNWKHKTNETTVGHVSIAFYKKGKLLKIVGLSAEAGDGGIIDEAKTIIGVKGKIQDDDLFDEAGVYEKLSEERFSVTKEQWDAARNFVNTEESKSNVPYNVLGTFGGDSCASWAVKVLNIAGKSPGSIISRYLISIPQEMRLYTKKMPPLQKKTSVSNPMGEKRPIQLKKETANSKNETNEAENINAPVNSLKNISTEADLDAMNRKIQAEEWTLNKLRLPVNDGMEIIKILEDAKTKFSLSNIEIDMTDAGTPKLLFFASPPLISNISNKLIGNNFSDWFIWGVNTSIASARNFMRKKNPGKKDATAISFGPLTGRGFGTYMMADPLTQFGPPGSQPNATNPTWEILLKRRQKNNLGSASYYVLGHLLNDNVHGTGKDMHNLTPLTQRTNNHSPNGHLRKVEDKVKKYVDDKSKGPLAYEVTPKYGRSIFKFPRYIYNIINIFSEIGDVLAAEDHVPEGLYCKVWEYDKNKGNKIIINEYIDQMQVGKPAQGTDHYYVLVNDNTAIVDIADPNVLWTSSKFIILASIAAGMTYLTIEAVEATLNNYCGEKGIAVADFIESHEYKTNVIISILSAYLSSGHNPWPKDK